MMDEENGVVHRRQKAKLLKKKSELRMLFQGESADDAEWRNCDYQHKYFIFNAYLQEIYTFLLNATEEENWENVLYFISNIYS